MLTQFSLSFEQQSIKPLAGHLHAFQANIQRFQIQIKIMKKSSSQTNHKLDFNLKDCKFGQSSVDRLPLKPENRRYSACHVLPLRQQNAQLQQLRIQNLALKKQNEQLKRQLESLRPKAKFNTVAKVSEYRDKIRSKMSSKVKCSRQTECDQALMTTKETSLELINATIADWYDHYSLARKLPALPDLQQLAQSFFDSYCANYTKLRSLFECLQCPQQQQQQYTRLRDLIDLYKVPLLYQKSPQSLLREISRSKEKGRVKTQREQICWETLSPQETMVRFEGLLAKIGKSAQMARALKGNQQILKFMQKIYEN